jgi:hypothetical protein
MTVEYETASAAVTFLAAFLVYMVGVGAGRVAEELHQA